MAAHQTITQSHSETPNKSKQPCQRWQMVRAHRIREHWMNESSLMGKKSITTSRWPGLPAVCCCLPSDKSEASGKDTERGGMWRRREGTGGKVTVFASSEENLQINTTAWCSEPPNPPPPLPPFFLTLSLTSSPSRVSLNDLISPVHWKGWKHCRQW